MSLVEDHSRATHYSESTTFGGFFKAAILPDAEQVRGSVDPSVAQRTKELSKGGLLFPHTHMLEFVIAVDERLQRVLNRGNLNKLGKKFLGDVEADLKSAPVVRDAWKNCLARLDVHLVPVASETLFFR